VWLAVPFILGLAYFGLFVETDAVMSFLAVMIAIWLLAQTLDLLARIRAGPAGLCTCQ